MPLPTVGAKGIGLAKLSPQVLRILKRRAAAQASRVAAADRPLIQADKQVIGSINSAYGTAVSSAKGAVKMDQSYIKGALSKPPKGLGGKDSRLYTQTLSNELAQSGRAIPFLVGDAAQTRQTDLLKAQQQVAQDRAKMRSDFMGERATQFGAELSKARTAAKSSLKAKAASSKTGGLTPSQIHGLKRDLKNALADAKLALAGAAKDGKTPRTPQEWAQFSQDLAHSGGGYDRTTAGKAVEIIQQQMAALAKKLGTTLGGHVYHPGTK